MHQQSIKQKGFATLLLVILIGSVGLAMIITYSAVSWWSMSGVADAADASQARQLVNACAEVALEAMRENHAYTGTGDVAIADDTCSYTITNTGGSTRSIAVSGAVLNVTRKLTITTSAFNPLTIASWQEVP